MSQHAANGALNRRAALASVTVALLLAALKGYAVWRTQSIAMLGSLADTGLDLTGISSHAAPAERGGFSGHNLIRVGLCK